MDVGCSRVKMALTTYYIYFLRGDPICINGVVCSTGIRKKKKKTNVKNQELNKNKQNK